MAESPSRGFSERSENGKVVIGWLRMSLKDTARVTESPARKCPARATERGVTAAVVARRRCDRLPFLRHSGRLSKFGQRKKSPKESGE